MLRYLSDRERGRLLLALIDYAQDGVLHEGFKGATALCYEQLRRSIDRNIERYQQTCERNREHALKRWQAEPQPCEMDAPACAGMPEDAAYANSNRNSNVTPNPNINQTVTPADTKTAASTARETAIAQTRARRRAILQRMQEGDRDAKRQLALVNDELDRLLLGT